MAKGDDARSRNQIDYQGGMTQNTLNNTRGSVLDPQLQMTRDLFTQAAPTDMATQGNIFSKYESGPYAGYSDFAKTGGYSDDDKNNIRSRALSPLRSVYSNANREVDRQRSLQGGYAPGHSVLKARMAREMGQGLSDATTNAEAQIAQMVQQGRLSGMAGQNQTLAGMTGLYGTTPGMTKTFGDMFLKGTDQILESDRNQIGASGNVMNAQIDASKLPGKWEANMGRVNDIFDLATKFVTPWGAA